MPDVDDPKAGAAEVVVAAAGATAATGVIERPPAGLAAPPNPKPTANRILTARFILKQFIRQTRFDFVKMINKKEVDVVVLKSTYMKVSRFNSGKMRVIVKNNVEL